MEIKVETISTQQLREVEVEMIRFKQPHITFYYLIY